MSEEKLQRQIRYWKEKADYFRQALQEANTVIYEYKYPTGREVDIRMSTAQDNIDERKKDMDYTAQEEKPKYLIAFAYKNDGPLPVGVMPTNCFIFEGLREPMTYKRALLSAKARLENHNDKRIFIVELKQEVEKVNPDPYKITDI